MLPRDFRVVGALSILFALVTMAANAQVRTTGQIVGTVRDASGAVVPDAEIQVRDLGTGNTVDAKSGRDGGVAIPPLPPRPSLPPAPSAGVQPAATRSPAVRTYGP